MCAPWAAAQDYVAIDAGQAQALYEAVQRDIEAGHFGKTAFRNEQWAQEVYSGDLSLYYQTTPVAEEDNASYSRTISINLSVYCTETLDTLKKLGILDEDHLLLTHREMDEQNVNHEDSDLWMAQGGAAESIYAPAEDVSVDHSIGVIG